MAKRNSGLGASRKRKTHSPKTKKRLAAKREMLAARKRR